jgi:hypothetical protein
MDQENPQAAFEEAEDPKLMGPSNDDFQIMEEDLSLSVRPILRRQTTTFAAYRQNITAREKYMARLLLKKYFIMVASMLMLDFFCSFAHKKALIT